jgi:hypothetical protein
MNLSSILQAPNTVVDIIIKHKRFIRNEDMEYPDPGDWH